ncbi:MAG: hypothetical protein WAU92_20090 [Candidatus Sulfotelmatobacter sp.]
MGRREQTRTLRFWFWVLVVAVAACSSHALCQNPHDYVPNLPYTAQIVGTDFETLADGIRVQREGRVVQMRDSQGRTRIESFALHRLNCSDDRSQPDVVNLYVPLRRQFIQLFPGPKTASVMTYPGTGPIPTHSQNFGRTTSESLPAKTINGIYAVGTRTTQLIPSDGGRGPDVVDVEEKRVSPDLKIIVLAKHTSANPSSDETITEIRELERSEPDAALFEIPTDYKVVTETDGPQGGPPPSSPNTEQQVRQP